MPPRARTETAPESPRSRALNMGVIESSVAVSSLLLWVPYTVMAIFVAYCASFYYELEGDDASRSTVPVSSLTSSVIAVLGKARLRHSYSQFYYYIFPEGFDITTFIPLLLRTVVYSAACAFMTFVLAVRVDNSGEMLMALSWFIGVLSESMWTTSSQSIQFVAGAEAAASSLLNASVANMTNATATTSAPSTSSASASASSSSLLVNAASHLFVYDSRVPHPSPWLWLVVSLFTGCISGIFCKAKDVRDGRVSRDARQMLLSADQGGGMFSRTGVVSVADLDAGRRRRHRRTDQLIGLADRMYMVVPFWSGQWTAFIVKHGWRGIIVENGVIVLTLGVIGYAMLSYRILQRQLARTGSGVVRMRRVPRSQIVASPFSNPTDPKPDRPKPAAATTTATHAGDAAGGEAAADGAEARKDKKPAVRLDDDAQEEDELVVVEEEGGRIDLMEIIAKLFTTSFGAVVVIVLVVNIFVSSLVIPFLKTLFTMNALVSSIGIIIEIIVYEIV